MYKIMTAGPTQVRENVRMARSLETTNPDLDVAFVEFYKETCDKLQSMLHCSGRAYFALRPHVLPSRNPAIACWFWTTEYSERASLIS